MHGSDVFVHLPSLQDADATIHMEAAAAAEKEAVDPLHAEAKKDAQKHASHVHRFNGPDALKDLANKLSFG